MKICDFGLAKDCYRNEYKKKSDVIFSHLTAFASVHKQIINETTSGTNIAEQLNLIPVYLAFCCRVTSIKESTVFVRSFHQGWRLTVGSLLTCLQPPPAQRPRHGPVRVPSNPGACTVCL